MSASLPEGYHYTDPDQIRPADRAELMRLADWNTSSPKQITKDMEYREEGIATLDVGVRAEDGRLVGFGRVAYKGENGELCDFVVSPLDRHQGIGRAIIDERLRRAEEAGITSLYIPELESGNSLGTYYEEKGFHRTDSGELVRGPHPAPVASSGSETGGKPETEAESTFMGRYLDGISELSPAENDSESSISKLRNDVMTPEEAARRLETFGYPKSKWEELLNGRRIGHSVRAEIVTALGSQPRSQHVLTLNLRLLDELDHITVHDPVLNIREDTEIHTPAVTERLARA